MSNTYDDWEIFRLMRRARQDLRAKYAVPCPECIVRRPKANPTMLLPQARCKIHGYVDPRPRIPRDEVDAIYNQYGITREYR